MSLNKISETRKRTRSNDLFLDLVCNNCNMDEDIQRSEKDGVSDAGIPNESYGIVSYTYIYLQLYLKYG